MRKNVAMIMGALAAAAMIAALLLPDVYAQRGGFALGGEWLVIVAAAYCGSRIGGSLMEGKKYGAK